MTMRGKHATRIVESFRSNGRICIPMPGSTDVLNVVYYYQDSGSVTCSRRSNISYVKMRASAG
eukprot:4645154-Heterocapsa_arctica.AAC.1